MGILVKVYTVYGAFESADSSFSDNQIADAEAFMSRHMTNKEKIGRGFIAEMIYVTETDRKMIKVIVDRPAGHESKNSRWAL